MLGGNAAEARLDALAVAEVGTHEHLPEATVVRGGEVDQLVDDDVGADLAVETE